MQDVDTGHPKADVLSDQRLYQVLPKNIGKTINQHRRGTSSFRKMPELVPVQREIPSMVGFQAVGDLARKWLKALYGGAPGSQFRTASHGAGHIDDQIRSAGRTDKVFSDGHDSFGHAPRCRRIQSNPARRLPRRGARRQGSLDLARLYQGQRRLRFQQPNWQIREISNSPCRTRVDRPVLNIISVPRVSTARIL